MAPAEATNSEKEGEGENSSHNADEEEITNESSARVHERQRELMISEVQCLMKALKRKRSTRLREEVVDKAIGKIKEIELEDNKFLKELRDNVDFPMMKLKELKNKYYEDILDLEDKMEDVKEKAPSMAECTPHGGESASHCGESTTWGE